MTEFSFFFMNYQITFESKIQERYFQWKLTQISLHGSLPVRAALTAVHQRTMSPFTPDTNCYYYGEYFMPLSLIFTAWWEWFMGNAPSGTICAGVIMPFSVNRARGWMACGRCLLDVSLTFRIKVRDRLWSLWCGDTRLWPHGKTLWQMWKQEMKKKKGVLGCLLFQMWISSLTVPAASLNWGQGRYIDGFSFVLDVKFGAILL